MAKINIAVGEKNRLDYYCGKKGLVHPFRRHKFWKFIGCILYEINYGKKGHNICGETRTSIG